MAAGLYPRSKPTTCDVCHATASQLYHIADQWVCGLHDWIRNPLSLSPAPMNRHTHWKKVRALRRARLAA
jgi:hypothetical protein